MISFIQKLVKVGNSKGIIIDSRIVKAEKLNINKSYKITIEEI
jgi:antitoxin component of MazEF toxin-antitoxin module